MCAMRPTKENTSDRLVNYQPLYSSQTGESDDLWQLWHASSEAGALASTTLDRGRAIAIQCRCALTATSHTSFATHMPPILLAALVRRSILPLERALALARQCADSDDRALAL